MSPQLQNTALVRLVSLWSDKNLCGERTSLSIFVDGEPVYTAACHAVRICITVLTGNWGRMEQRPGKVGPPVE